MEELTPKVIETLRDAAGKLTGSKRRAFEARVSLDYLGGDTRLTETVFGWSRHTVAKGIKDHRLVEDFVGAVMQADARRLPGPFPYNHE